MKKSISLSFVAVGIMLLCAAIGISAYNIWDARNARISVESVMEQIVKARVTEEAVPTAPESAETEHNDPGSADAPPTEAPVTEAPVPRQEPEEIPLYKLNPQLAMPTMEIDGRNYVGVLEIPVLSLTLPIIGEWSYPSLKLAPCVYTGTAYLNNMVIAGHNYTSHFGGLSRLRYGDRVVFTDFDGNVFQYKVREIETIKGTDIDGMVESGWALSLFTCTIGGQMRITVRCECVSE